MSPQVTFLKKLENLSTECESLSGTLALSKDGNVYISKSGHAGNRFTRIFSSKQKETYNDRIRAAQAFRQNFSRPIFSEVKLLKAYVKNGELWIQAQRGEFSTKFVYGIHAIPGQAIQTNERK
ncbi:MAG: hypothetical protein LBG98_01100 [Puniceicoccales bacterium]|jgi:hypothetical protein|nr:hypothetical protein [Puniceicoccales bacterium]